MSINEEFFAAPSKGVRDAITNRLAKETKNYLVEYGVRTDDMAMVFHFFPPMSASRWDARYKMEKRLEIAMPACFDTTKIQANEVLSTMRSTPDDLTPSYCIIVRGLGSSLDPWPLVNRFFEKIDSAL